MINVKIFISNISNKAGTERAVTNLANILSNSEKYKVEIISLESSDKNPPAYTLYSNVKVTNLELKYSKNPLSRILRHIKTFRLIKNITSSNTDIIVGTEYYINYIFCFLNKKIIKVGCEHTNYDKPGIHHKFLRKIFYPYMNAVVMLTKNDTERYTFLKNKYCIPNSISFISDSLPKFELKTFLAVGRLTFQKGFDMLIEAAAIIKKDLPDWKINIYGNGEDKDALIKKIDEYNLSEYVFIKEPVNNISEVYSNSSIYLLSSRFEGFPMVLVESQSVGMPTIAFNCPEGPSEIIVENRNGFLIKQDDVKDFAQKAIQVGKSYDLWKKMSEESLELSKRYTPENIYTLWDNLFTKLISE